VKATARQDKALLLKTAQTVADELKQRSEGTSLRLRWPFRVGQVNTGGWRAKIGDLGKGQPCLQIWLDLFAGYDARKFNFCFYLNDRAKLRRMANRASKQLPVYRRITEKDTERDGFYFLSERLHQDEFGPVILEEYWGKWCYYGIYLSAGSGINPKLCARAAAFFETVARTMPDGEPENETHEIYAQIENRKLVVSHIQRERSRFLASECKERDKYQCQVCNMRFEQTYGDIGKTFAEAHHIIPLSELKGRVKTRLDDLVTVCANCHRMLHRMDDKRSDVQKLKAIVSKHRGRRK
jgi:5-methylcytosine-specific restriction endonuclease McrA